MNLRNAIACGVATSVIVGGSMVFPQNSDAKVIGAQSTLEMVTKEIIPITDPGLKNAITTALTIELGHPATEEDFTSENLSKITTLAIYLTPVHSLSELKYVPNLEALNISNNGTPMASLSPLEGLNKLVELSLNGAPVGDEMYSTLNKITSLKYLDIAGDTPNIGSLDKLPNLESVSLTFNNTLEKMPTFETSTQIKALYFSDDNISELPDYSHLVNLERLELGYNNFTSIPDLSAFSKLTALYMSENAISDTSNLETIQNKQNILVDLTSNLISKYAPVMGEFKRVMTLNNFMADQKMQYMMEPLAEQVISESSSIVIPLNWALSSNPSIIIGPSEFTEHQRQFVDVANLKIATSNDNIDVSAVNGKLAIHAKEGIIGMTEVKLSYNENIEVNFGVAVE
ncbi:hypothetical protein HCA69_05730 [Listeria grandensis]|uniref:Uncharacterized protein n=1 Tax=Listeria grandensis TaxID=1494963 RepID=A0A7X1CPC7_9LIST|nr:leucine-rich repeat domain-containing protein [Listeria grandensis]MBC1935859.1 hypothetical protein [Listeria grandensis]